ncbi:alpha/beta hydrolase [Vogesella sp. XCS3]|uniref:alpha/beta hydrolase n=1 Tax=Vogesella sp. XCS3 TaxID=2877939 RepID=UPI001D0B8365|nr:alpha/beta hydrolase [Vogesella sp. XCS3]UDM16606.1 alpha/beta hydrolase [Vogesella sp. XCS3]
MPSSLPLLVLADSHQSDGNTLLALARRQGVLLDGALAVAGQGAPPPSLPPGSTPPFILLAHGIDCLPALQAVRADPRCRAALLLSPDGDARHERALAFPALVVCHRPDPRHPRLTQAATLASVWQARLHLLQSHDALAELAPLFAALARLAAQPLGGDC